MPFGDKIRECVENVNWKFLEKLKPRRLVIIFIVIDFFGSLLLMMPTIAMNFLYTNAAGRGGFIDKSWNWYEDIYHFRRRQDWENLNVIDWEKDDHIYINKTRSLIDDRCSQYESEFSIPGDPGDYVREIVGHPNESGYNSRIRLMIDLFTASIGIIYFGCPILLVSLWWRQNALRIAVIYIVIQSLPMFLCLGVCIMARMHLMCAINVIYGQKPVAILLLVFTTFLWLYSLTKFVIIIFYCIELHLAVKKKDFTYEPRKPRNKVEPAPEPEPDQVPVPVPVPEVDSSQTVTVVEETPKLKGDVGRKSHARKSHARKSHLKKLEDEILAEDHTDADAVEDGQSNEKTDSKGTAEAEEVGVVGVGVVDEKPRKSKHKAAKKAKRGKSKKEKKTVDGSVASGTDTTLS